MLIGLKFAIKLIYIKVVIQIGVKMGKQAKVKRPKSKIAELRQKAGLTQAQLAVFIGVTPNTIQNWEKDDGLDQLEKYLKLCVLFGCKIEDLVEYVEADENEKPASKGFSTEQLQEIRKTWDTAV